MTIFTKVVEEDLVTTDADKGKNYVYALDELGVQLSEGIWKTRVIIHPVDLLTVGDSRFRFTKKGGYLDALTVPDDASFAYKIRARIVEEDLKLIDSTIVTLVHPSVGKVNLLSIAEALTLIDDDSLEVIIRGRSIEDDVVMTDDEFISNVVLYARFSGRIVLGFDDPGIELGGY